MRNNRTIMVILTTMLVILLIGAAGYELWRSQNQTNSAQTQASNVTENRPPSSLPSTTTKTDDTGTVTGTAVYPSDAYPSDYQVCVVSATSGLEIVCDNSMAGARGSREYKVTVTPGTYKVVAKTNTMSGYYDGYMKDHNYKTGTGNTCDPAYHTPLEITVVSGQELTGIDAGNFYYEPRNC